MLKKLYKYEFYALFRNLMPIYAAVVGFALLSRLTSLVDINKDIFNVLIGFIGTFYVISIIAAFIVSFVVVVMRFYKNLLSHEGYLTFTLPFTPTQHIVCKLLCGVAVIIISFVIVLLSLGILGAGTELMSEIIKIIKTAFLSAGQMYSSARLTSFFVQLGIMIIVSLFQSLLMFYAAIAIGQQFRSKIGGAVVAFICLYAASQVIATLELTVFALFNIENIENYFDSGLDAVQSFLIMPFIVSLILSTAYFIITRHFLTKKLNLE